MPKKLQAILKIVGLVSVLLVAKYALDYYGLDIISLSPLIAAFLGGVMFLVAIILTGTFSDYKESEKIPGELASSIKTLYKDIRIASQNDFNLIERFQSNVKELLKTINSNFNQNVWKQSRINAMVNVIDDNIIEMAQKGIAPQYITKLRSELTNIDKISNRIETIKETSFVSAFYYITELAVGMLIFVLLFTKIDPFFEGLTLFGVISSLIISLIVLIKDMDDPFETGKKSFVDVDLKLLYKLEESLTTEQVKQ